MAQAEDFELVSVGAPLLSSPEDYRRTAKAVAEAMPVAADEALVLMGHGTDHPMNAAYPAMAHTFWALGYRHIFVGTVEGWPQGQDVLDFFHLCLRGLGVVPESVGSGLRLKHIQFSFRPLQVQGLGQLEAARAIYLDHARQAIERL